MFDIPDDAPPHILASGTLEDGSEGGAIFSPCDVYRYVLWRVWDHQKPIWLYGMLNPSKATHKQGDPTIDRQIKRTRINAGGGIIVVNTGALRETDRQIAINHPDPIGPDNLFWIQAAIPMAQIHVLAHGPGAAKFGGEKLFRKAFDGIDTKALNITKDGWPGHPLYVAYSAPLLNFRY